MRREGIIIDTRTSIAGSTGSVPQVPSNQERYAAFVERFAMAQGVPAANNFPWQWKSRRKKSFMELKPRERKKRYGKVNEISVE